MRITRLLILALAALLFFGLPSLVGLYTDWLWFGETGYQQVFATALGWRLLLGAAAFVFAFGWLLVNFRVALSSLRLGPLVWVGQQGVQIELVVSGACALRPGVPGLSDGIRVVATADRHFETSRLFAFGRDGTSDWFLSSGDLALARLGRQIDVAVAVVNAAHRARLEATMEVLLRLPAWEMDADGVWHRHGPGAEDALSRLASPAGTPTVGGARLR